MGAGNHPWAGKGKEQGPWRRERGHNGGHQDPHTGRACHNGGSSTAPPRADTARSPEAHAPNTRHQSTNRTPYGPHRLTPTSHQKPHRGRRAHLHREKGLHPQRKPPRTPPRSAPPCPHRQATTPATARATSQTPEEEESATTAPRARGKDPQRTQDQSRGPREGNPADTYLTHQPERHTQTPTAQTQRCTTHLTAAPSNQPATL